ncbi:MAG: hypothetical protein C4560_11230 [Nitrospiraceae bacterium]|nr:MAG: hypothetical protein C4560_11230 [Nitrospiraceae bacterium]
MKILFHICCGNCALYPIKLSRSDGHDFTGFWYNPNIHPHEEYQLRLNSLKKLSDIWHVEMIYENEYKPEEYFEHVRYVIARSETTKQSPENVIASPTARNDNAPPFPERCKSCYRLRLEKTARSASDEGFDAFSTTLLISPYQDYDRIVTTGKELSEKHKVAFYEKDFRPHFRDAIALSKELGLYRQKYCGCVYSRQEREEEVKAKELSRRTRE